jgi:SAM-dependent methyltransferase
VTDVLDFDDEATARLEALYLSADVRRRRALATEALAARAGERILDVGCGPGFFVAELSDTVGPEGHIVGVDPSAPMLANASRRTEGRRNVTLLAGNATELPVPDRSFDAALSVQVFEYVDDVGAALAELVRVLRPGGRAVIWDIDWSTVSWFSDDPERMRTMLQGWDDHLVHPALPQRLAAEMRAAGFVDVEVEGHAFTNTDAGPDTYSGGIIPLVADFVVDRGIPAEDTAAWRSELEALSAAGRYFFTVTQCCFSGTLPV